MHKKIMSTGVDDCIHPRKVGYDMTMIDVLDPAGQVQKIAALLCTPIDSLAGRRLAILDNMKPNFQQLAMLVGERLRDECSLRSVSYFRKQNPSTGAGAPLLDQIALEADLVLTGSAD
jgi:hypothetical protein